MKLSNEAEIILSLLSIKPNQIAELCMLFVYFNPKVSETYHSLEVTININLKRLMKLKLIKREGTRGQFIYSISHLGLKTLIRHQLRKMITIT